MREISIKRTSSLLVLGIGLVAVLVFGASWLQTNSQAQSKDTVIKGGNLVLRPSKIGTDGLFHFQTEKGVVRSALYIYGTDLLRLSDKAGTDMMRVDADGMIYSNGTSQLSSRSLKDNITNLSEDNALAAFTKLQPVLFNYKNTTNQQAGFIAEDVPDVIAAPDHKSINPLEVTALLTSVVKTQQKQLETQEKQIQEMRREIEALKRK